jgi:hypothetical protein
VAAFVGNLVLRERGPQRLELALSPVHRVAFAVLSALAVFILLTGVLFEGETTVFLARNAVAWILVLVMLFGLLYEDRWTFDLAAGRVENRFGTVVLARRTGFALADLERIGLDRFTRGRLGTAEGDGADPGAPAGDSASPGVAGATDAARATGPFGGILRSSRRRWGGERIVRLVAVDRTGEVHVLDVAPVHRLAQFRSRGLRIARFCGVGFADETSGSRR